MDHENDVAAYLCAWGYRVEKAELVLQRCGIQVFWSKARKEEAGRGERPAAREFYVILGYGPPAHFPVAWQKEEAVSAAELVLYRYLGGLTLVSLSVEREVAS